MFSLTRYLLEDYIQYPLGEEEMSSDERNKQRGATKASDGKVTLNDVKFVAYLHKVFCSVYIGGSIGFYNWNLHRYEFLDAPVYMGFFKELLDDINKSLWNRGRESNIKQRFERDITIKLKEFVIPEDYIVFSNGVFKLSSNKFIKGDQPRKVINTCCTGYDFDKTAKCPLFINFVKDIFNDDADLIAVVQEVMGYTLLYGKNPMQAIVILLGGGRNGKGILANVCQKVHGLENCSGTSVAQLSSKFGLGQLYDKVLNVSSENDENILTDTSILKSISGNDVVMVERKYKDAMPVRIFCKLWIQTNDIRFRDSSKGFEERLIPIPFMNTYVDNPIANSNQKKRDNSLEAKLDGELAGIFNWMYEGLIRLKANNWSISDSNAVNRERRKMVEDSNPVQMFFASCYKKSVDGKVKRTDTFELFNKWASDNNINVGTFITRQRFYKKFEDVLEGQGISKTLKKSDGIRYYTGITTKTEEG